MNINTTSHWFHLLMFRVLTNQSQTSDFTHGAQFGLHSAHITNANAMNTIWPITGNMTSSTKPEVHNILHCHQKDTAITTGNMSSKFCEVWTCRFSDVRADRQTGIHKGTKYFSWQCAGRLRRCGILSNNFITNLQPSLTAHIETILNTGQHLAKLRAK